MKRLLLILALLAPGVAAQTPALVTGKVFDTGGNPATSGYVQFDIQPNASSIQFFVENVGSIAPPSVQCPIDGSGNISCNVWGNDVITPANTTYVVTFAPGGNISNVVNSECIHGASYNLNHPIFCPNVQVNPQQAIIRANPFDTNIIAVAPDVFNVGSPTTYWAAGYFDNLFAHHITTDTLTVTTINGHIPGTVTSVGLTLPAWLTVVGSPVTTTGTFAVTPTTGQASHQVIGTCGGLTTFQPCTLTGADISGGVGTGTVTSIATTLPIVGGTITTTGTLSCPTCVVAPVNPSAGVGHFAGGTQTITSSQVINADLANPATTVNGVTCTLGSTCTVPFSGVTNFQMWTVCAAGCTVTLTPCATVGGSSFDQCTDTIVLPVAYADTFYSAYCAGVGPVDPGNPGTPGRVGPPQITAMANGQFDLTTSSLGATVVHWTRYNCWAGHP